MAKTIMPIEGIVTNVRVHTVQEQAIRNQAERERARIAKAKLIAEYGRKIYEAFKAVLEDNFEPLLVLKAKKTKHLDKALEEFAVVQQRISDANEHCARKLVEKVRTHFATDKGVEGTVNNLVADQIGDKVKIMVVRKDGQRAIVAYRK